MRMAGLGRQAELLQLASDRLESVRCVRVRHFTEAWSADGARRRGRTRGCARPGMHDIELVSTPAEGRGNERIVVAVGASDAEHTMRNPLPPDRQRPHDSNILGKGLVAARAIDGDVGPVRRELAHLVEGGRTDARPSDPVGEAVENAHGGRFTPSCGRRHGQTDGFHRPDRVTATCEGWTCRQLSAKLRALPTRTYYDRYWTDEGFNPTGSGPFPELERVLEEHVRAGEQWLDVGCGDGRTAGVWLAARGCDYVGVDVSSTAVDQARGLGLEARVIRDASDLPFDDETFAGLLAIEVLEHFFEPQRAVAEFRRVLRPGGILFVSLPNVAYWRRRLELLLIGRF